MSNHIKKKDIIKALVPGNAVNIFAPFSAFFFLLWPLQRKNPFVVSLSNHERGSLQFIVR